MMSEICEPENWDDFRGAGDLDFAYEMDEDSRFRCNFLKQANGYGAVFRLIPTKIASLEQLGIPPVVKEFGHLRSGLVLVTGPTGSGKSTTLAALIDYINANFTRHIITIEEPIEFVHRNKRASSPSAKCRSDADFPDGLRAALREDADIVLVGEMRDLETISLALTAAETGLLVFGTLHTNNARKTVDRIVDVFPANKQAQVRTMLATSLRGVVAQLLLKKADGSGRVAVNEILVANRGRLGHHPRRRHPETPRRDHRRQRAGHAVHGRRHLGALQQGVVSPKEAYMKAIDKSRFKGFLAAGRAGPGDCGGFRAE